MARIYYTMETVEQLRAALRAMPPRLPIPRAALRKEVARTSEGDRGGRSAAERARKVWS